MPSPSPSPSTATATASVPLIGHPSPRLVLVLNARFARLEIKKKLVEFDFAFSGLEALNSLSKAHEKDYILILSDINMPGMSGLDLLKEIKSTYKSQKVMIITAFGDDENYAKAVEFGANDFLVKPIDFQSLKSKIFCIS